MCPFSQNPVTLRSTAPSESNITTSASPFAHTLHTQRTSPAVTLLTNASSPSFNITSSLPDNITPTLPARTPISAFTRRRMHVQRPPLEVLYRPTSACRSTPSPFPDSHPSARRPATASPITAAPPREVRMDRYTHPPPSSSPPVPAPFFFSSSSSSSSAALAPRHAKRNGG